MTPDDVQRFTTFISEWWHVLNILFPYVVFLCFGLAIFLAVSKELVALVVRRRVIR